MKILLDHCLPHSLRHAFPGHTAETTAYNGWEQLSNGRLLDAAEARGFDVLLTIDSNLRYQQNFTGRAIRVLVLETPNNLATTLLPLISLALATLTAMQPREVKIISHSEEPHA